MSTAVQAQEDALFRKFLVVHAGRSMVTGARLAEFRKLFAQEQIRYNDFFSSLGGGFLWPRVLLAKMSRSGNDFNSRRRKSNFCAVDDENLGVTWCTSSHFLSVQVKKGWCRAAV